MVRIQLLQGIGMSLGRKTQESSDPNFVIIPFNYFQLPEKDQMAIIPICIATTDRHGNVICQAWFERGVAPIQDQLRAIARYRLGDVYRVSELAEATIHKLWEHHGDNIGFLPWHRVLTRATWEARHMAVGGSQWRSLHFLPLALGSLDRYLYHKGMADGQTFEETFRRDELLNLVEQRLEMENREEFRQALRMLREGYYWDEIAKRLQAPSPEALRRRFWRWISSAFPLVPE
jgi:hypothetical protein